jgi:hypothetical protein
MRGAVNVEAKVEEGNVLLIGNAGETKRKVQCEGVSPDFQFVWARKEEVFHGFNGRRSNRLCRAAMTTRRKEVRG